MSAARWTSQTTPIRGSMHHQPRRLVHAGQQRAWGPSADRLTTLEGMGNLAALGSEDEWFGVDEEAEAAESDTDWVDLVKGLATALSPVAAEGVKAAFARNKNMQGLPQSTIMQLLGMGEQRAAQVKAGTASMPTAGWVGIGVAAVAALGLILVLATRK